MTVFCEAKQHEDRDHMSYILDNIKRLFQALLSEWPLYYNYQQKLEIDMGFWLSTFYMLFLEFFSVVFHSLQ